MKVIKHTRKRFRIFLDIKADRRYKSLVANDIVYTLFVGRHGKYH